MNIMYGPLDRHCLLTGLTSQPPRTKMERTVRIFVIPNGRSPGGPPMPPREVVVSAPSVDQLRAAAVDKLAAEGLHLRSLSFGPSGLIAYVNESDS